MTQIAEPTSNGLIPARVNGGLFLQGFAGSAVLLLAIDATEPLFFGPGYFAGLTYHPFWIVILLAAVQHGLFVGLSVVGLAALLMDWPTRPLGVDITAHYADIATAPAQWLLVALIVGLYRQHQLRNERAIRQSNARLQQVNQTLVGEIRRLDSYVTQTEQMVAIAGSAPNSALLSALDALARADASRRGECFVAAARLCLPGPGAWLAMDGIACTVAAATQPDLHAEIIPPDAVAGDNNWHTLAQDPPALCAAIRAKDTMVGLIMVQTADAGGYEVTMDALRRALQDSLRNDRNVPVLRLDRPKRQLTYAVN